MKVTKAIFEFRGWKFVFISIGNKESHGRIYTIWEIEGFNNRHSKTNSVYKGHYLAFVPSACICRRIVKAYFRKSLSTKRKKQLMKNLI